MADGGPARRPGETTIGQERHLVIQPHPGQGRGGHQHLPHPWPTPGPFVPDDDHVAGLNVPAQDGLQRRLLVLKDTRRPPMLHHPRQDGRCLDHRSVWGQVAPQDGDPPIGPVGIVGRADDVGEAAGSHQILGHGLSRHRPRFAPQQAVPHEFRHHRRHPSRLVQVLHVMRAGGTEFDQVGSAAAHRVELGQRERDARFVGDGGQVQHRVGRAANGHIHGDCVLKSGLGHNVARENVFTDQVQDLFPGLLGQPQAGRRDGRDGPIARQSHAQRFGQAVHRVGGEQAGAGATAGAGRQFQCLQFLITHSPGLVLSHRLEHCFYVNVLALVTPRHHRPTADKDGGDVEPGGGHQHARHDFITVWNEHQSVKPVSRRHDLDRIGDQFPAGQGIMHPWMAHGDTVAHADGVEL